jgi:hypothetical protein
VEKVTGRTTREINEFENVNPYRTEHISVASPTSVDYNHQNSIQWY